MHPRQPNYPLLRLPNYSYAGAGRPTSTAGVPIDDALLRSGPDLVGPREPVVTGTPDEVWLTAESLGARDPALVAWPAAAAVFAFDEPLLSRLRLSAKRLVFIAETLAELAAHRPVRVLLGDPVLELRAWPWRQRSRRSPYTAREWRASTSSRPIPLHGWCRLPPAACRLPPAGGDVRSHSAWIRRRAARR